MDAGIVALIVIVVLILIVALILKKFCLIVHQAEGVVVERLGKFYKVFEPGLHCLTPCDTPRSFRWTRTYIDSRKRIRSERCDYMRIDMRESLFNFPPWQVYTRDTVNLNVNMLMYYRIFSVKKAVYGVDDLHASISNVAQAEIKVIFGSMTFTVVLSAQDKINALALESLNRDFKAWGVVCTRLEVINIQPPTDITSRLRQQMLAERDRRAQFVIAEGKKSAVRLQSESTKVVKFQMGVAEQEAKRKRSEGKATATVKLAQAESGALHTVQQALAADGVTQTDYKVSQRYLQMMGKAINVVQKKTIYLPYAAGDLMGNVVGNMPKIFGRNAAPQNPDRDGLRRRGPSFTASQTGSAAEAGPGGGASKAQYSELD